MPVVTYICSLHGVIDKGVGWTTSQIDYFRSLLLYKTVIAKFEYQSVSEGVHYVTLYGDENTNINNLFSSKESCSLGCEKTLGDYAIRSTAYSLQHPALQEGNQRKMLTPGQAVKEKEGKGMLKLPSEELRLNSSHMAAVQDIADPSEFWIQTHNYADELDTLMDSIYHLYKNPMNNDVMETVSLYDLRRICPEFLTLHGQAFRCSLLNPVDPTTATNEWSEEAIARFHSFVETAASNFVILKCTIYAVMYSEQKIVFNIVDLETPFESISTSMVSLVKSAPTKKVSGTSFRLDTYYYSTHNVKTGTEEQVTVTCVNNVSQFYCQLKRNADVIKDLRIKVNNLCHQLENVKLPTVFGTLCFAKYTDGHWYRGQIKATKPVILVHFVDYGDTIEVEKSDLLPVPREANDIMSVPVQAVLCGLCDVPAHVPSEVNSWFETSATECKFRALVVAREPDGKLLVELYHGNTQINSKIKKMFQIEMHTEGQVVCHGRRAHEASANHAQKTPKAFPQQAAEMEGHSQPVKKNVSAPKSAHQMRNTNMNLQSVLMPLHNICENGQKVKAAPLQLYRPPHQRQSSGRTPNNTENGPEPAGAYIRPRKESPSIKSKSPDAESQKDSNAQKLPKLEDLPSKSITPGKLNDPQSTTQTIDIKDVHPGDLVQAEFADDSSWYRAVVTEIQGNMMVLVEFVDFGNTAVMPISKIGRLQKHFLQSPMYSTHCMLSSAAALGKEEVLDAEVVSAFKEDISGTEEKVLKCQFIRQSGSLWEIDYIEEQGPGELVEPQRADEVYKLESSSQHYESPEDCLIPESFAESAEEERDKILTFSNEGVIVDPAIKVSQTKPKGISPCESEDETVLPSLSNIGDHGILTLSCDKDGVKTDEGTEEEGASVMDTIGPVDFKLTLVGNPTEAIDEAEITMTRLESLLGEVKTYLRESSFGIMNVSDPNEQRDDIEVVIARDKSPGSMSTVKMVPREDVHLRERMDLETIDEISKDLIQTELVPSSHVLPVFEQETKAGDGVPKEQIPCVATHVKNDLMAEEDTLAQHDVLVSSAPLAETNTAACEPHTCTAPSRDSGDEVKEVTCSDEEACLMDVCTDPHEPNDDSKVTSGRGDCLRSGTEQEVVQNESLFSLRELPHEQFIALPSDTEPQTCTAPFPDLNNLVEEVTCLVREICLTDVCRDPQKEAETEDREQLVHTPPEQEQDFSDGELEKEASSSADDSFEAQLSKIIHLSLIINDASADNRHVKQQPEE
ncbi:Tudor domain-containing protein 6 [Larimichthys crocea]|uniref:Tudor domain-containing protein 6 n=1 Tax=Larimichthys crocea TaxID=215358 RepID=A0A6G0I6N3_LARCR|nr:Tudor domain-containing protein 6 [Larimichthys crocea]